MSCWSTHSSSCGWGQVSHHDTYTPQPTTNRKKLGVNAVLKTLLRRFYAPQMEALAEREAAKVCIDFLVLFVYATAVDFHSDVRCLHHTQMPLPLNQQAAAGPAQGADRLVDIMDRYPSNSAIHECVPSESGHVSVLSTLSGIRPTHQ